MTEAQRPEFKEFVKKPGFIKTWITAVRPFSFSASTMPVIFGTILPITIGEYRFNLILFLAAFFGMVILHAAANLLNDVYDYRKKLDRQVNPVSGAVVRGWISSDQARNASIILFIIGGLIGLFVLWRVGTPILWIGLPGIVIGILYSWGPLELKYNALGDLAVFLNFGILGAMGAWTVQTGEISLLPAVWSVPMSILVIAILHANNWRDIQSDTGGGISTMASVLGDRGSEVYYTFLLTSPFVIIVGIIAVTRIFNLEPKMPFSFLIVFLALFPAIRLIQKAKQRKNPKEPLDFVALDGATAQLNLIFGLLCSIALGVDALIQYIW